MLIVSFRKCSLFLVTTILLLSVTLCFQPTLAAPTPSPGDYIVTEYSGDKLSMITPGGVRTVIYTFAASAVPGGVAIDGAGNYIVTEVFGENLVKITPGGVRTVIYSWATLAHPTDVVIDSAGNYIVTEHYADVLSKVTPGGVRTPIYSYTTGISPDNVAIDGAGNYIVTESGVGGPYLLSMITPGGVRTVIYTFASSVAGVAVDGAGDYIVCEFYDANLVKITPGGVRTVIYSYGTPGDGPTEVVVDSAGNYIVTDYNDLSMITPSGVRTVIYSYGTPDPLLWDVAIVPTAAPPPPEEHDVEAVSQVASATEVMPGDVVAIDVTVTNNGDSTETFDLTCYYDSVPIGIVLVVDLAPGESRVVTFTWDTTGLPNMGYAITAWADSGEKIAEVDETNNWCTMPLNVFVIPELPLGTILAAISMFVALIGFVWFKRFRPKQ
jgi:hypothetical protein